jgi:lipopolysaccharide/colanic/teichoic acid biosynthesis glycosyltransferase
MTKRMLDITVSGLILILLSPIFFVLAIIIRIESPGPAMFRTMRVGQHHRPFTLFKLRSMRHALADGPSITAAGDDRITRIGRFCRRYKLDELPQLINVLRGEMSLVGPRPEDPRYVDGYSDRYASLLQWRPGLTSPGSIAFRNEEDLLAQGISAGQSLDEAYSEVQRSKLELELDYFPSATLRSDVSVLFRTAAVVVRG